MSDAPKIHSTMSDLDAAAQAGPYRHGLPGGKRITFPDPGEMDWMEAEAFLGDLEGSTSNREMLEKWLSKEDFKKLADSKINLYQLNALAQLVSKHYQAILGGQGNGIGSTES